MVHSESTIEKIKAIIEKHYSRLVLSVLGSGALTKAQVKALADAGFETEVESSLLTLIYNHMFINTPPTPKQPKTLKAAAKQQSEPKMVPKGEAHDFSIQDLNASAASRIKFLSEQTSTRFEGLIRSSNQNYKNDALQNLNRSFSGDRKVKKKSVQQLIQDLKAITADGNRDWERVALTELSNSVGIGSVDRIVVDNVEKDLKEVYVYRIIVGDSVTCKFCRQFYGDVGQVPKVYRLSTLLANGVTNYGRKQDAWMPVIGATHPNTRTSGILELKPGWQLKPGGSVTFIGKDKWSEYITELVEK